MEQDIKMVTLENLFQVQDKLNEWSNHGYNLANYYIGMVKNGDGTVTIYYDQQLDIP